MGKLMFLCLEQFMAVYLHNFILLKFDFNWLKIIYGAGYPIDYAKNNFYFILKYENSFLKT